MARKPGKGMTIVLRREEVVEAGHHGGAWKVAYADFVTAMMAFFLLMWLINATTAKQRRGIADYFSPSAAMSTATSGSGKPFGGRSPFQDGSMVSDRGAVEVISGPHPPIESDEQEIAPSDTPGGEVAGPAAVAPFQAAKAGAAEAAAAEAVAAGAAAADPGVSEQRAFEQAAAALRRAVAADPSVAGLGRQLLIDETPEGLRIQIVDQSRRPMFASGSAELDERARGLLAKIAPVLNRLPERISISGHTDATPYRGGGGNNWELSSERADATLRLLLAAGLPPRRVRDVTGAADDEPLIAADPGAAANRRIAIVVLRAAVAP